ncbi:unnamed protein product [Adineta steineri]|uniref:Meckel syndrome type 1 protein n=2 Tax=Adineta steineri TaxID=433720 RepID=A0A814ZU51_9BILA|nr:unnamed protein product [Adineta steineri]CAF3701444.1 unnamed protein product [Adineta steineri]
MSNFDANNVNCAVYRSNDSINNFKIRVKLERLTSNALLPSLERLKYEKELSRLLNTDGKPIEKPKPKRTEVVPLLDQTHKSNYEEVVISWQQKLFNRYEFEKYGKDMGPYKTALEQKYLDEIQKMKAKEKQPGRIFTYVENDSYCLERSLEYFMTDSPNEQPSHLALGINTIHQPRTVQLRSNASNKQDLPKTDLIKQKPTSEDLLINHYGSLPRQTMYIMADLSDTTNMATTQLAIFPQPPNEHVLCRIHYSNNTIILEPDFNTDKMAYIVETGNLNNEVYQYYLEHVSIPIDLPDLVKERRLFNEICLKQQTKIAQIVGNEFDIPPPSVLKLNVFGEIVSGKNFEYDNIYVYYSVDLTDNWYVESSAILSGYTHTASTTMSSKYDDIVYYSHPFEFELWYKPPLNTADHELPRMPKIYFQISSHDSWGRHRIEGYTYFEIPNLPGFYNEHLSCWRPRGDSVFNEVRRFFIGGSLELEDISYIASPKSFDNEKDNRLMNRFGFRTVSTGTLNVRFNVVFQSQNFAIINRKKRTTNVVNRYGLDTFISNINTVLQEFEEAKKRAYEVRESTAHMHTTNTNAYYE